METHKNRTTRPAHCRRCHKKTPHVAMTRGGYAVGPARYLQCVPCDKKAERITEPLRYLWGALIIFMIVCGILGVH